MHPCLDLEATAQVSSKLAHQNYSQGPEESNANLLLCTYVAVLWLEGCPFHCQGGVLRLPVSTEMLPGLKLKTVVHLWYQGCLTTNAPKMMTSSMRRYLRQQYGTDDVKRLQKTLGVEAGDTADSRAKAAGMSSSGHIRSSTKGRGTLDDTFRRQIKKGVKAMSASESLPALMRTGESSRKKHTASASQLPTLSAKTSETNGVPLKLRENTFGATHYTKPKDERKREALRAVLFKKLMARYANRVRFKAVAVLQVAATVRATTRPILAPCTC